MCLLGCCLATGCITSFFYFCKLDRVYGAIAWQCVDQIPYNICGHFWGLRHVFHLGQPPTKLDIGIAIWNKLHIDLIIQMRDFRVYKYVVTKLILLYSLHKTFRYFSLQYVPYQNISSESRRTYT
jgi:hypothetical protein